VTRDLESLRAPLLRFCAGYLRDTKTARNAIQEYFHRLLTLKKTPKTPPA